MPDSEPGGSLVCRREDLVRRLRAFQEGEAAPEIQRRKRVERYLAQIAQFSTQKHTKIAQNDAANAILSANFKHFPPGIELRKRELRIQFSGSADFLQKFGAVVFALQNELDQIRDFLDSEQAQ